MTFGVYYGVADVLSVTDFAQTLERLGFETIWIGDGPTNRHPYYEPFVALAHASAATKHLKLGSCVAVLPLFHPVRLAQSVATLDVLSGGRAIVGVGAGGEFEKQFEAFGIPLEERGRRTNEYIEIMKNLWTEEVCNFSGSFYDYEDITMEPKPVQQPHPPVWVGGRLWNPDARQKVTGKPKSRTAAVRRAAKYGQAWFPYNISLDQFQESMVSLKKYAVEFGRDMSEITVGVDNVWIIYDEEASADAAGKRGHVSHEFHARLMRYGFVGTTQDVIRQLEPFVDAGARHFVCNLSGDSELVPRQMELVARDVIPYFR